MDGQVHDRWGCAFIRGSKITVREGNPRKKFTQHFSSNYPVACVDSTKGVDNRAWLFDRKRTECTINFMRFVFFCFQ